MRGSKVWIRDLYQSVSRLVPYGPTSASLPFRRLVGLAGQVKGVVGQLAAQIGQRPIKGPDRLSVCLPRPRSAVTPGQRLEWEGRLAALRLRPRFSLLVVSGPSQAELLGRTRDSLAELAYTDWEALPVEIPPSSAFLAGEAASSSFAGRRRLAANVVRALNRTLDTARGDFVGVMEAGDELDPTALLSLAEAISQQPAADFLYTDEDRIDGMHRFCEPCHKPGWSPELLLSQHYTGRLMALGRDLLAGLGGVRAEAVTAWEYDLALRAAERAIAISRVPRILYHRRDPFDADQPHRQVKRADTLRVLRDALARQHLAGRILPSSTPGVFSLHLRPRTRHRVSIIIPTRDRASLLDACVRSVLERTEYRNYEIVIVDNGSQERTTAELFDRYTRDERIRILRLPGPFNFSLLNNLAVQTCDSLFVLLLNNDVQVITPHWLSVMIALAERPQVGAVGAKLYFANNMIQHAGVILRGGGNGLKPTFSSHKFFQHDDGGYFGFLHSTRNLSAVTAACLLTRSEIYQEVGGLDETLAVAYNDVDFCLKVRSRGYRIVWTPLAELYHYESASRGRDQMGDNRWEDEKLYMRKKWGRMLYDDPYYNPNLSLECTNFRPRDNP